MRSVGDYALEILTVLVFGALVVSICSRPAHGSEWRVIYRKGNVVVRQLPPPFDMCVLVESGGGMAGTVASAACSEPR